MDAGWVPKAMQFDSIPDLSIFPSYRRGIAIGTGGNLSPQRPWGGTLHLQVQGPARASGRKRIINTLSTSPTGDVHLDEPWLLIRWDGEHKCVYAQFKAFANSAEFRSGTLGILDAIRARSATSLVSDNRRLEGVAAQDQLWIRDTWTPLAVAAGLTRIAVVLAPRGLGKIASEQIIGRFGDKEFATRTFESLEDAMKWVRDG